MGCVLGLGNLTSSLVVHDQLVSRPLRWDVREARLLACALVDHHLTQTRATSSVAIRLAVLGLGAERANKTGR